MGTNEVEKYASVIVGQCVRKTSDRGLVVKGMQHKVEDADWCARQARFEYFCAKKELYRHLKKGSFIDHQFQRVMRSECEELWSERREHNRRKIEFLQQKRRSVPGVRETDIRGVKYRDEDLNADSHAGADIAFPVPEDDYDCYY